jgi:hypothetical protein
MWARGLDPDWQDPCESCGRTGSAHYVELAETGFGIFWLHESCERAWRTHRVHELKAMRPSIHIVEAQLRHLIGEHQPRDAAWTSFDRRCVLCYRGSDDEHEHGWGTDWRATALRLHSRIAGDPLWKETKSHLDDAVRAFNRAAYAQERWQLDAAVLNAMQAVIHAANGVAVFLVGSQANEAKEPDVAEPATMSPAPRSAATARQAGDAIVGAARVLRSALSIVRHT